MDLDKIHESTWWSDATRTDMEQLDEYDIFNNLGKYSP